MKLHQRVFHIETRQFGVITRIAQCGMGMCFQLIGVRLDSGDLVVCQNADLIPAFTPRPVDHRPSDSEPRGAA